MSAPNWPELLEALSQPFPASAVSWRAGSTTRDKKRAQALPYAEPRVYEDVLNRVVPGDWGCRFLPWGESGRIICELTIHGVVRASTGEENDGFAPGTAAEAQAFKRACSKFGLGRYLYDVPIEWVGFDEQKKRLLEVPKLSQEFLPVASLGKSAGPQKEPLSKGRGAAMTREFEKLGLSQEEQLAEASRILGRPVTAFAGLPHDDALKVWNEVKASKKD